jgi:glycosyltransferase involved in cell wall biosynthesis
VICDRFPSFEHLPVERTLWSNEVEGRALGAADVGISWVPDDSWSRGKCGLKILQYMAAGLPVVASPVGVHSQMVSQGTGFLPARAADWIDCVRGLVRDARLRAEMGWAGRRRVEMDFSLSQWGPVFAAKLAEAAAAL